MSDKYKEWEKGGLVTLDEHSRAKHDVLRTYVERYIEILLQPSKGRGIKEFKITLVDGFAGAGLYEDDEPGSPLILLQAVENAEAKINHFREKKITVDAHCYFIEKMKNTFSTLSGVLSQSRYKDKIGKTIFLKNGLFEEYVDTIIENVKKRNPRGGGRVIFFLDQTGHSQVYPQTVRDVVKKIPKAEFIITISTDWLVDFISDKRPVFEKSVQKLGLEQYLNIEEVIRLKKEKRVDWRYIIEAKLSVAWQQATGASYFRPFLIEPKKTHRGYWLLHLSPHPTAHDAMTDIHWEKGNYFRHYGGGLGIDIFGYKPQPNNELNGISFSDTFRHKNEENLIEELPHRIWTFGDKGVYFEELINMNRNFKAVSNSTVENALLKLREAKEIEISGRKGGKKRSNKLSGKDIVRIPRQRKLF
ncbi:three-Cys-motif partner protein TcmP [Candidatus Parabeggiatoa sp. HSG14]|uniref:three-Cys-motif partner protein TcmP n=1 Tax=Candidatus Parabeggiatoa sp. HSG14 TaxID=3055593 RepID=UPI0025A7268D|nr:three-Cys-motif partner protein TcmP [Thiotrichales bacterium HSG14]